jgi:hypothetical protein
MKGDKTMSENKEPYDVLVAEEYTDSNGEVKTSWSRVGVAFKNQGEGFSVIPVPGVALTGRFIIAKRKTRDTETA